MKEEVNHEVFLAVSPEHLYTAWLDSNIHTAMTGGEADCGDQIGDEFSAWDGYISGKNLELVQNEKIVQTWRTVEFLENDEDSLLTLLFEKAEGGTKLVLIHKNIPEGQTQYDQGWVDNYFEPMKLYFDS